MPGNIESRPTPVLYQKTSANIPEPEFDFEDGQAYLFEDGIAKIFENP